MSKAVDLLTGFERAIEIYSYTNIKPNLSILYFPINENSNIRYNELSYYYEVYCLATSP